MSHISVLVTSEKCGHCRNMRGSGRLLSQNEIKKDNRPPNLPNNQHYDAKFMRKILTGGSDSGIKQLVKLVNIHYKSFNPMEGIADICIFNMEGASIKQSILKESNGKTSIETYLIGESGKLLEKKELPSVWSDTVRANVPINITMYAHFFPILTLFHSDAWNDAIQNSKPVFGYVNGLETKLEAPYGALPSQRPNVKEFSVFIKEFFDGTRKLEAVAPAKPVSSEPEPVEKKVHFEEKPKVVSGCEKINFRLYVKE